MKLNRYTFQSIFSESLMGLWKTKFNTIVNEHYFKAGSYIPKTPCGFGGITLDNYVGKDIAATFNKKKQELVIKGFYPAQLDSRQGQGI